MLRAPCNARSQPNCARSTQHRFLCFRRRRRGPEDKMPHVVSLAYKPADVERRPDSRFSRLPVGHVRLVAGHGIAGDTKGRSDSRQLNVLLAETVEQLRAEGFRTAPGELGEQIVIAGLPAD